MLLEPVPDITEERGLAAYSLRMKPGARTLAPDPAATGGQYLVVLRARQPRAAGERAARPHDRLRRTERRRFALQAGPEGLDALVLHFPRHDAPIERARVALERGFRRWRCLLCSFVYDEAQGLPEEGIAPGTPWEDVPQTWSCADCGATKADFEMVEA